MRSSLLQLAQVLLASAGRLNIVTSESPSSSYKSGVVDPGTGALQLSALTLPSPPLPKGCNWRLLNQTHGQTSARFYVNSSLFIISQVVCDAVPPAVEPTINRTAIMVVHAFANEANIMDRPHPGQSNLTDLAAAFPGGDAGDAMSQIHMHWDDVCNLILTFGVASKTSLEGGAAAGRAYKRVEVSEYDGQVRALPDAALEDAACTAGCWKRVAYGAAGLASTFDFGAWRSLFHTGLRPREANCGVECASYVIEAFHSSASGPEVQGTRRIVGRGVHNSSVVSNVSEGWTGLSTMSWLHPNRTQLEHGWKGTFFGLGVCCELRQCPPECQGHGGQVSLLSYYPEAASSEPKVLWTFKGSSAATDERAFRLGVALDPRYPVLRTRGNEGGDEEDEEDEDEADVALGGGDDDDAGYAPRLSVWVGGAIVSFRVGFQSFDWYATPELTPIETSPPVGLAPGEEVLMMGYTFF